MKKTDRVSTALPTHTCAGSDDVVTMEEVMNIVVTMEEVMKKVVLKHCRPYETLNFPYACLSQADLQCCWNLQPRSPQYRRSAQDVALAVGAHFHFTI